MTPAETLREAARRMRERAQAATPGPWKVIADDKNDDEGEGDRVISCTHGHVALLHWRVDKSESDDAAHIASWHPIVAHTIADWLTHEALKEEAVPPIASIGPALRVARAYLGDSE